MKIIVILFVIFAITAKGQIQETEVPMNPEFKKFIENKLNGIVNDDIPFYALPSFDYYSKNNPSKNIKFDSYYDLRTLNLVTPVKSQGSCGCCWSFASLGSIESYWLKNGYGTFDLSEQNVRTCNGFFQDTDGSCTGGNPKKTAAYLTRGEGPVLESDDSYNTDPLETCDNSYTPVAYVGDIRIFPSDANTLKQQLLNYGALYTNMMYSSTYLNSSDETYYYSGTDATNHAVLLVGWDDNKVTAGGTGAWIIKNSYGTSFGENGFFYVSYNDSKITSTNACFPSRFDYNPDEKIYMYDELGWISSVGYSTETAYALIKFTPLSNEKITRIGSWVNTASAVLDFEIYNTKSGNTLTDLMGSLSGQICDFPGFYSFSLSTPINVNAGDDFYIKVKYYTPGYTYPIPIEKLSDSYAEPTIESGVCWGSSSGTSWTAFGSDVVGKERDLCIRAYTIPQTTGNNSIDKTDINIIPGKSSIQFKNLSSGKYTVELFTSDGKKAGTYIINTEESEINGISTGIYVIRVSSEKQTIHKKLFIE